MTLLMVYQLSMVTMQETRGNTVSVKYRFFEIPFR